MQGFDSLGPVVDEIDAVTKLFQHRLSHFPVDEIIFNNQNIRIHGSVISRFCLSNCIARFASGKVFHRRSRQ